MPGAQCPLDDGPGMQACVNAPTTMASPFTIAVPYTVECSQPRPPRALPNHCGLQAEGPASALGVQLTAFEDTTSGSAAPAGVEAAGLAEGAALDVAADAAGLPASSPAVDTSAAAPATEIVTQRRVLIMIPSHRSDLVDASEPRMDYPQSGKYACFTTLLTMFASRTR